MTENDFASLKRSVKQAADIARGEREPASVTVIDPDAVFPTVKFRLEHDLSHDDIAAILGVSVAEVVRWEVDEQRPSPPVQLLLELLLSNPQLVIETAKRTPGRVPDRVNIS